MTDSTLPTVQPILHKPPGYRDPTVLPSNGPRPPPRKPPLPPALRHPGKPMRRPRRTRSFCCRLCWCIVLLLFTLLFFLAISGALSYLYFQPHLPSFRIQSIQSPVFNITTKSNGENFLNITTVVKILASNTNSKIGLRYGDGEGRVYLKDADGDVAVGTGSIPVFEQGKLNATVIKFSASEDGVLVDDAVAGRMKSSFRRNDIRYGVEVRTRVGLKISGKMTGRLPVWVLCTPVSLRQVKGGGSLLRCHTDLLRLLIEDGTG